jgi:hypothetical protein
LRSFSIPFSFSAAHVRFGSKADIGGHLGNVRFTPKADIETQSRDVRFVPKADIGSRFELMIALDRGRANYIGEPAYGYK